MLDSGVSDDEDTHVSQASPTFLSLSQAADALGVSPETVREWFDAGKLSGYRTPGQHRRISTESITALQQDGAA